MFTMKVDEEIDLHLFQPYHTEELFHLVEANRHYLREWLPWVDEIHSPWQFESLIRMWLKHFADHIGCNLGIRYKGILVGSIDFHQLDWYNRQASIGYFLAEAAQGQGIITRAVQRLIHYGFIELGLNRIEIRCGEKNRKSRSIPEKLGFTFEGCIREGEKLHGHYHHLFVYSMLAREWLKHQQQRSYI